MLTIEVSKTPPYRRSGLLIRVKRKRKSGASQAANGRSQRPFVANSERRTASVNQRYLYREVKAT